MILAGTNSNYWIAAKSPYSNEFSCIVNQEMVRYTSTNYMTGLFFVCVGMLVRAPEFEPSFSCVCAPLDPLRRPSCSFQVSLIYYFRLTLC